MSDSVDNSWHKGELIAQERANTKQRMAEIGPQYIRQSMPQQHRDFFESLSMLFIGYKAQYEHVHASVLFGEPGFIHSLSETELVINIQYSMGDFDKNCINVGDKIGLLGLVFNTKRRNRLNVIITDINQKTMTVKVLQSYGNCSKYIHPKTLVTNTRYNPLYTKSITLLIKDIRQVIKNSGTFFIASSFNDGEKLDNRGVDISHRGGDAGFIAITENDQLLVEDYPGNGFFNTIGNLLLNPLASLLFFDWQQGHTYQVTVSTDVIWLDNNQLDESNHKKQAERMLCFTPLKIEMFTNGLAICQTNND